MFYLCSKFCIFSIWVFEIEQPCLRFSCHSRIWIDFWQYTFEQSTWVCTFAVRIVFICCPHVFVFVFVFPNQCLDQSSSWAYLRCNKCICIIVFVCICTRECICICECLEQSSWTYLRCNKCIPPAAVLSVTHKTELSITSPSLSSSSSSLSSPSLYSSWGWHLNHQYHYSTTDLHYLKFIFENIHIALFPCHGHWLWLIKIICNLIKIHQHSSL